MEELVTVSNKVKMSRKKSFGKMPDVEEDAQNSHQKLLAVTSQGVLVRIRGTVGMAESVYNRKIVIQVRKPERQDSGDFSYGPTLR